MKKISLLLMLFYAYNVQAQIYVGNKGEVNLKGVAPKETITAESKTLEGKFDASTRKFNFRQKLNQFSFSQGEMQKKDAEEKYWETDKYPHASFKGEVINTIDFNKDGEYQVTTKGVFSLHGVEKEIKVPAKIKVENGSMSINATFNVYLSDYNIKIPRLVVLKVSESFEAKINMNLTRQ